MGFLTPKVPTGPVPKTVPIQPSGKEVRSEAESARRDLMERMMRAGMNRRKSQMQLPALVKPAESNRRSLLTDTLG